MAVKCAKCKDHSLTKKFSFSADMANEPLSCKNCGGIWLSGVQAQQIDQHHSPLIASDANSGTSGEALDLKAGLCPKGHGIMERAKVEGDQDFILDRCGHCLGIWFDQGEWDLLTSSAFLSSLQNLWDPMWQKRQREQKQQHETQARLKEQLGDKAFAHLEGLIEGLKAKRMTGEVIAYMREAIEG